MKPIHFLILFFACLAGQLHSQSIEIRNSNNDLVEARYMVFMDPMYGYGNSDNAINFSSRNFWSKRAQNNQYDHEAWFNYYKATRFIAEGSAGFSELQSDLDSIDLHLQRYSPGTWEQLVVEYWNSNRDPLKEAALKTAYEMDRKNPLVLRLMTGVNYLHARESVASDFYLEWKATGDAPVSTETYAFNVMQSLTDDAVIFTNGELDTYPLIYQLHVNKRTSVKVISLAWCERNENRKEILANAGLVAPDGVSKIDANFIKKVAAANPGKRIFVASTCNAAILTELKGKLYCTGLAFRYSEAMIEHKAFLQDNVGVRMKLNGVGKAVHGNHRFDIHYSAMLDMNYYLPLLLAADAYAEKGNTAKATELRSQAKTIRIRAGYEEPLRNEGE